ncbi:MAG: hypothetical protein ABI370_01240 [Gammaproteobacteria bacterium]
MHKIKKASILEGNNMFSDSTFKLLNSLTDKTTKSEEKSPSKLESPFVFFDLNLSSEQKSTLAALKISQDESFENNGNFKNILTDIEKFISALDKQNAEISVKMAELILEIINKVISEMRQESAWIVMRSSQPNDAFKDPRWHTDGFYFPPYEGEQFKVVVTLAGPGTLFYNLPDQQRETFNSLNNDRVNTKKMLENITPVSPASGQGAAFIAGSKTRAAVHSEPYINSARLFLAVAPCSHTQLDARLEAQKKFESSPEYLELLSKMQKSFSMK